MYFFWIAIIAIVSGFFYLFAGILSPFLLAIGFFYILAPIVAKGEAIFDMKRGLSTLLVTCGFFGLIVTLLSFLGPMIYVQLFALTNQIIINQDQMTTQFSTVMDWLGNISPQVKIRLQEQLDNITGQALDMIAFLLKGLLQSGAAAANTLSFIVITPLVTFYLLKDSKIIAKIIHDSIPLKYLEEGKDLIANIQKVMTGFFMGQFIVCSILAIYYTISFFAIGMNSWLGLGVLCGVLIFIPYVGSCISTTICLLIGLMQFGFDYSLLAIVIVLILAQIVEGVVLTPKFIGGNVGLHPVWIIFSLLASWNNMGLFGVFIAVPVAATIGVILRFSLHKYRKSRFYNAR